MPNCSVQGAIVNENVFYSATRAILPSREHPWQKESRQLLAIRYSSLTSGVDDLNYFEIKGPLCCKANRVSFGSRHQTLD